MKLRSKNVQTINHMGSGPRLFSKAAITASRLLKSNKTGDIKENYWFPTPEDAGDPPDQKRIQKLTVKEMQNIQEFSKKTQPAD